MVGVEKTSAFVMIRGSQLRNYGFWYEKREILLAKNPSENHANLTNLVHDEGLSNPKTIILIEQFSCNIDQNSLSL